MGPDSEDPSFERPATSGQPDDGPKPTPGPVPTPDSTAEAAGSDAAATSAAAGENAALDRGREEATGHDPFAGPEWSGAGRLARSSRHSSSRTGSSSTGSSGTRTPDTESAGNSDSTSGASGRRVKVSRRRKRKLRRRRRIGLAMVIVGGVVVLAALWLLITGLMARSDLETVRTQVAQLRRQITAGQLPAARATARSLAEHASDAHDLTDDPLWALASDIPAGGEPLRTIRGVTAAADSLGTNVLPKLVDASERLDPSRLRASDGRINLQPLVAVAPDLNKAAASASEVSASVQSLPAHTWLSSIDSARSDVLSQVTSLERIVHSADLAARIAPAMLGSDGPRNYLVAFQTEAELRGAGGLPGAFAIVRADQGKISFTRFESDTTLLKTKTNLDFGKDFNLLYRGDDATTDYLDSNVSPHFPYAARVWTTMWRNYSGQKLDGAMAVDPTALGYLLSVTGPAKLPDNSSVSARNVVALTERDVYGKFARNDQGGRKTYQLQIAKAISEHLLDSPANTTKLLRQGGRAVSEHRVLLWSADPDVESALSQTVLGGTVPTTTAPYAGIAMNNSAANKLDYYLHASVRWQRDCRSEQAGAVTVTMTLRNDAPTTLPAFVYGYTGRKGYPQKRGDTRMLVSYYATQGAQLSSVTLNGKASTSQIGAELGHPVYTVSVPLPRGRQQTVVLHLTEPVSTAAPIVRAQPLAMPLHVTIDGRGCQ